MKNDIPVIIPEITVVAGTSVTFTFPSTITAVTLGESFKIPAAAVQSLGMTVGTEEVIMSVGASEYKWVDNLGVLITAQMLLRAFEEENKLVAPYYLVQVGLSGADTVFYGRRGFYPRKTTVNIVDLP